jgi:hypothetical protein
MFSNIIDFAKALYAICRLEAGPQKLPFSSTMILTVSLIMYILGRFWVGIFDHSIVAAVFLGVFDAVLLVLMAGVPLTVLKLGSRIPQTLLALASAGFVVSIVDVFLLFLLSDLPLPEDLLGRVITFLTFPIFLWKVLINTTLLRYALSWNFTYAFTLAIVHVSMVVFLGGAIASGLEG